MFKEGDTVKWPNEDGGRPQVRYGKVVQVVESHRRPDRNRFPSLFGKTNGFGFGREEESYVVRSETTNYWPEAYKLEKA